MKKTTANTAADIWDAAWTRYIESIKWLETAVQNHKTAVAEGKMKNSLDRYCSGAKVGLTAAVKRLRQLDADFCNRHGIYDGKTEAKRIMDELI